MDSGVSSGSVGGSSASRRAAISPLMIPKPSAAEEKSGIRQLEAITTMLLGFAQKNRGMTRMLIGDALVHENQRLQLRINQLHDRVEATLKQAIRFAAGQNELPADIDAAARANLIMSCVSGRWQQFAKSGFKRDPMQYWPDQWRTLIAH